MPKLPFRLPAQPAPVKPANEVPAPPPGRQIVRSQRTGDPLPQSSQDAPGHSPPIKWGPAKSDPKPFK